MTTNLQRASLVARDVQLQNVSLASTSTESNLDPLDIPDAFELSVGYRTAHRLPEGHPNHLYVLAGLRVEAGPQNDETSEPYLVLEVEFELVYALKNAGDYPADAIEYFSELNGPYNAWPYFREFLQSISTRVGLGGIVLPVFRPPIEEIDTKNETTLTEEVADQ